MSQISGSGSGLEEGGCLVLVKRGWQVAHAPPTIDFTAQMSQVKR